MKENVWAPITQTQSKGHAYGTCAGPRLRWRGACLKKILADVWGNIEEPFQVLGDVSWGQAAHQVHRRINLCVSHLGRSELISSPMEVRQEGGSKALFQQLKPEGSPCKAV